jgi:hypothetical protein
MKLTRRELAPAALAALTGAKGAAQAGDGEQDSKAASEDAGKRAAEIRNFKVPAETEPAFAFRAQ